jgi:hypothetical protein
VVEALLVVLLHARHALALRGQRVAQAAHLPGGWGGGMQAAAARAAIRQRMGDAL